MVRHAYFREYSRLQKLCLLILRHREHFFGIGSNELYGILFDGAWLWEEYLYLLMEDEFFHPRNKRGQGRQHLFSGDVGWIYPDFIGKDPDSRIIADAKYKPTRNIGNRDYLQLLAYMFRFDSKAGFFLYPETEEIEMQKLWLNQGSSYEKNVRRRNDTFVAKHGLRIPSDCTDYASFLAAIKISEREFLRGIINLTHTGDLQSPLII